MSDELPTKGSNTLPNSVNPHGDWDPMPLRPQPPVSVPYESPLRVEPLEAALYEHVEDICDRPSTVAATLAPALRTALRDAVTQVLADYVEHRYAVPIGGNVLPKAHAAAEAAFLQSLRNEDAV